MTLLQWKDEFDLGVAPMDREHKGLVDAMNAVHALDQQGAGKERVDAAIRQLMDLTVQHFADEEAHMEKVAFPDRDRHARIHKDMLRRVGEHYEAFRAGDGNVGKDFYDFLVHWLAAHICHIDRKYVDHAAPTGARR